MKIFTKENLNDFIQKTFNNGYLSLKEKLEENNSKLLKDIIEGIDRFGLSIKDNDFLNYFNVNRDVFEDIVLKYNFNIEEEKLFSEKEIIKRRINFYRAVEVIQKSLNDCLDSNNSLNIGEHSFLYIFIVVFYNYLKLVVDEYKHVNNNENSHLDVLLKAKVNRSMRRNLTLLYGEGFLHEVLPCPFTEKEFEIQKLFIMVPSRCYNNESYGIKKVKPIENYYQLFEEYIEFHEFLKIFNNVPEFEELSKNFLFILNDIINISVKANKSKIEFLQIAEGYDKNKDEINEKIKKEIYNYKHNLYLTKTKYINKLSLHLQKHERSFLEYDLLMNDRITFEDCIFLRNLLKIDPKTEFGQTRKEKDFKLVSLRPEDIQGELLEEKQSLCFEHPNGTCLKNNELMVLKDEAEEIYKKIRDSLLKEYMIKNKEENNFFIVKGFFTLTCESPYEYTYVVTHIYKTKKKAKLLKSERKAIMITETNDTNVFLLAFKK